MAVSRLSGVFLSVTRQPGLTRLSPGLHAALQLSDLNYTQQTSTEDGHAPFLLAQRGRGPFAMQALTNMPVQNKHILYNAILLY